MKRMIAFLVLLLIKLSESLELASNINFTLDVSKSYTEVIRFQNSRPTIVRKLLFT